MSHNVHYATRALDEFPSMQCSVAFRTYFFQKNTFSPLIGGGLKRKNAKYCNFVNEHRIHYYVNAGRSVSYDRN